MRPSPESTTPTSRPGAGVRPAAPTDVGTVARLHRSELRHGLYPLLGERFLRRYHMALLESPHTSVLVAGPIGAPLGFVVMVLDPPLHRAWLRGHEAAPLALHGALGLLTHPRALWLFVRTRLTRYLRAAFRRGRPETDRDPPAVLLHVAVDEAGRGEGIGSALVAAGVREAGADGRDEVRLVTSADSAAGRFYDRLGWARLGRRPGRDGGPVTEFSWSLGEDPA